MDGTIRAPEFPAGPAWLNTERPLRFGHELKGQVVLLDFWTYCCINCMHVLPQLERLEKKFAGLPFVVVGVHSAKYENENRPANVKAAVRRYEIAHPVVVDQDMRVWSEFGIRAWPTLVLVGADGRIIGGVSGEGHEKVLEHSIEMALKKARERGVLASPLVLGRDAVDASDARPTGALAFPGKVLGDERSRRVFIADSNHNRVIVVGWPDARGAAKLLEVIGSGESGSSDGAFDTATLHRPQGLALAGDTLWVADTENHLIRAADLSRRTVRTVLGTGRQEFDAEGGKTGREQTLNSPWDVAIHGNKLYIAMAGTHQIWVMNTFTSMAEVFAGSGRENIRDDAAREANLAQPSGMALDVAKGRLYFADSEVSAVRYVDMKAMRVETIIGHDLFDFGDVDGEAEFARLQHCLGVCVFGEKVLVADTYNHKIKLLDPEKKTAVTWGDGALAAGEVLREPASVWAGGDAVLVADTNNHRVMIIDRDGRNWREMTIEGLAAPACTGDVCVP